MKHVMRLNARRIQCEMLEGRIPLSASTFVLGQVSDSQRTVMESLSVADVDSDGDLDVVFGGPHGLYLGENVNSEELLHFEKPFTDRAVLTLAAGDLNGDGSVDVVAIVQQERSNSISSSLLWYENNGEGGFPLEREIPFDGGVDSVSLHLTNIDDDQDLDIVAADDANGLTIFENVNSGVFEPIAVAQEFGFPDQVIPTDFDSDGDVDLLLLISRREQVAWVENIGNGTFAELRVLLRTHAISHITVIDVDGDQDQDFLFGHSIWSGAPFVLAVHEQLPNQEFGHAREIPVPEGEFGTNWLAATDVDADGDVDIFAATSHPDVATIALYENVDGIGEFAEAQIFETTGTFPLLHLADMDGDGDVDVLSAERSASCCSRVFDNRLSGDADDNGEVNFADFLALSAHFGRATDAVWEDGDFNGDSEVNFADFLLLAANFGK